MPMVTFFSSKNDSFSEMKRKESPSNFSPLPVKIETRFFSTVAIYSPAENCWFFSKKLEEKKNRSSLRDTIPTSIFGCSFMVFLYFDFLNKGFVRALIKQLATGFSQNRMHKIGCNFNKRRQHKKAFLNERMRYSQIFCL